MSPINLADVMDEIGDRLDTISGLRVYRYPPDNIQPPAAVVTFPATYTFDETYGRGMDRLTLPVVVMVGKVSDRAARGRLAGYCNGTGTGSVKAAVESAATPPASFDSARVQGAEFDVVSVAGVEYLAATFTIDIAGQGA